MAKVNHTGESVKNTQFKRDGHQIALDDQTFIQILLCKAIIRGTSTNSSVVEKAVDSLYGSTGLCDYQDEPNGTTRKPRSLRYDKITENQINHMIEQIRGLTSISGVIEKAVEHLYNSTEIQNRLKLYKNDQNIQSLVQKIQKNRKT